MKKKIIIIGGGPGGYVSAVRASQLGADVTLVEQQKLGGTCLNWGCIPSKILKNSADLLVKLSKAAHLGIDIEGCVTTNLAALMSRKDKVIQAQQKGIESLLLNNNISIEFARAHIIGKGAVALLQNNDKKSQIGYDKLIIATGTEPLDVPNFSFDHERILSSNDILCLNRVPESIVIVGGGVVGCEFAFILSALGTRVTIVEAMPRLLPIPSVDEEISKLLAREMKKHKIKILCNTVVKKFTKTSEDLSVDLEISSFADLSKSKKLKNNKISAEKMLVCIGRSASSIGIGLENIGIKTTPKGWIEVDDYMETSVEGVFAIGDVIGPEKIMLAHVASHEGITAVENAIDGKKKKMDYDVVPSAIFTMPEIGTVGLSEEQAKSKGFVTQSHIINFRTLGKAQAIDEIAGAAKMVVEKNTNKILGVHLIGPHATDLIGEATIAIKNGFTTRQIADTIHAHPTLAEIMGELAFKASGIPIHG